MTSRGVGLLNFSTIAGGIFPSLTRVEWRDCFWQIFGIGTTCCHKDITSVFLGIFHTSLQVERLFFLACSNSIVGWRFPNFRRIQRMCSCKCHCLMVPWVLLKVQIQRFVLGKKIKMEDFIVRCLIYCIFFFKDAVRFQLHFMNPKKKQTWIPYIYTQQAGWVWPGFRPMKRLIVMSLLYVY